MKKALITLALTLLLAFPANAQVVYPNRGGTGTSTIPQLGQVLVGQSNGTYAPQATSTLGILQSGGNAFFSNATSTNLSVTNAFNLLGQSITDVSSWFSGLFNSNLASKDTDDLEEGGTNLYYTDDRVDDYISDNLAGQALGLATLDGAGKVPTSQLPNSIMQYQGTWDASTNTPTLADGTGDAGDVYRVSVAGSHDFGSGSISFGVGDYAIYNNDGKWEKSDTTDAVSSVNGYTGDVTIDYDDLGTTDAITEGSTNLFSQWGKNGSNIYYTAGNVGVGVTNPTSLVHVDGSTNLANFGGLAITEPFNNDFRISLSLTGGNRLRLTNTLGQLNKENSRVTVSDSGVELQASENTDITLTTAGNIGIGTTSPNVLLLIHKESPSADEKLFNISTGADAERFWIDEDGDVRADGSISAIGGFFGYNTSIFTSNVYLATAGGNVGIGTTTPARKLHISDTLRLEPRASAPTSPALGDLYVDSDSSELCFYTGSAWVGLVGGGTCE